MQGLPRARSPALKPETKNGDCFMICQHSSGERPESGLLLERVFDLRCTTAEPNEYKVIQDRSRYHEAYHYNSPGQAGTS